MIEVTKSLSAKLLRLALAAQRTAYDSAYSVQEDQEAMRKIVTDPEVVAFIQELSREA